MKKPLHVEFFSQNYLLDEEGLTPSSYDKNSQEFLHENVADALVELQFIALNYEPM